MADNIYKNLSSSSFLIAPAPILREELQEMKQFPKNIELLYSESNSKLLNKQCETHKNRVYEQICSHPDCLKMKEKILFCSKCILENENHSKNHRTNICDIEVYLFFFLIFLKKLCIF
jgi:hypothetical protein